MEAKSLLIPLAAFALSATGVSAFNSDVLEKAGLTEKQIAAFEEARELREDGDIEGARDVLIEAGINLPVMESVREAMHEKMLSQRTALDAAIDTDNYQAFKEAIEGSPLADIVTSEDDFQQFSEAHRLHKKGKHEEARMIMEELGFPHTKRTHMNHTIEPKH